MRWMPKENIICYCENCKRYTKHKKLKCIIINNVDAKLIKLGVIDIKSKIKAKCEDCGELNKVYNYEEDL